MTSFSLTSLLTQLHAVRDRKARTGAGWDARDSFELKDVMLGTAVMMLPIAAAFAFVDPKLDMPSGQWWGALLAIGVISAQLSMRYGRWSVETRKRFAANSAAATYNSGSAP